MITNKEVKFVILFLNIQISLAPSSSASSRGILLCRVRGSASKVLICCAAIAQLLQIDTEKNGRPGDVNA